MHVRPTQTLHVDVFVRDGLQDARPCNEHVARAPNHVDEVRNGRRIHGSAGTRAENHADLGNDT